MRVGNATAARVTGFRASPCDSPYRIAATAITARTFARQRDKSPLRETRANLWPQNGEPQPTGSEEIFPQVFTAGPHCTGCHRLADVPGRLAPGGLVLTPQNGMHFKKSAKIPKNSPPL